MMMTRNKNQSSSDSSCTKRLLGAALSSTSSRSTGALWCAAALELPGSAVGVIGLPALRALYALEAASLASIQSAKMSTGSVRSTEGALVSLL